MANAANINIGIGIDKSGVKKGLNDVKKSFQDVAGEVKNIGQSMSMFVTAPILGAAGASLKLYNDFEFAMNSVEAKAKLGGRSFDELSGKARELGSTTNFSATEAANAMGFLAQAGWDTDQIFDGIADVLNLAAAEGMDLARAADIASNVISGMGMEVSEAGKVMDILALTAARSNTDISQLGEAMKFAGPAASAMGIPMEEAAAIIGKMGDAGIQSSMAGTTLRTALIRLAKPTKEVVTGLDSMGLKLSDLQKPDGSLVSLPVLLGTLQERGMDLGQAAQVFGARAATGMLAAAAVAPDLRILTTELEGAGGAAAEMAETKFSGMPGAMAEFKSAVQELGLSFSESGLADIFESLIRTVTDGVRWFSDLNPAIHSVIGVIAGLAAAIGPVLLTLGTLGSLLGPGGFIAAGLVAVKGAFVALAAALGPVTLAVGAVAAAVVAMMVYWDEVTAFFSTHFPTVVESAQRLWMELSGLIQGLMWDIRETVGTALEWIVGVWDEHGTRILAVLTPVMNQIKTVFGTVFGAILDIWTIFASAFKGDWDGVWMNIKMLFGNVWDGIVKMFKNAIDFVVALMPDFVKEWLGIEDAVAESSDKIGLDLEAMAKSHGDFASNVRQDTGDVSTAQKQLQAVLDDTTESLDDTGGGLDDLGDKLTWAEVKTRAAAEAAEEYRESLTAAVPSAADMRSANKDVAEEAAKASKKLRVLGDDAIEMAEDAAAASDDIQQSFGGRLLGVFDGFRDHVKGVFSSVKDAFSGAGGLGGAIKGLFSGEGSPLSKLKGALTGEGGLGGAIKGLFSGGGSPLSKLKDTFMGAFGEGGMSGMLEGLLGTAFPGIMTALDLFGIDVQDVFKGIKNGIASVGKAVGGVVKGIGSAIGSIFGKSKKDKQREFFDEARRQLGEKINEGMGVAAAFDLIWDNFKDWAADVGLTREEVKNAIAGSIKFSTFDEWIADYAGQEANAKLMGEGRGDIALANAMRHVDFQSLFNYYGVGKDNALDALASVFQTTIEAAQAVIDNPPTDDDNSDFNEEFGDTADVGEVDKGDDNIGAGEANRQNEEQAAVAAALSTLTGAIDKVSNDFGKVSDLMVMNQLRDAGQFAEMLVGDILGVASLSHSTGLNSITQEAEEAAQAAKVFSSFARAMKQEQAGVAFNSFSDELSDIAAAIMAAQNPSNQTIVVNLDGRQIGEAAARHAPEYLEVNTAGIF